MRIGFDAVAGQHFDRLVAVAGDADDDRLVARNRAALDELPRRRDGHAAGRLGEDAFGLGQQLNALDDLVVCRPSRREPPVARSERSTWKPSAGLPMAIDLAIVFGLTGSGNSSPASSARTTGAQPAACAAWMAGSSPSTRPTRAQLLEALEDARQQRAAGHRRDDVPREASSRAARRSRSRRSWRLRRSRRAG